MAAQGRGLLREAELHSPRLQHGLCCHGQTLRLASSQRRAEGEVAAVREPQGRTAGPGAMAVLWELGSAPSARRLLQPPLAPLPEADVATAWRERVGTAQGSSPLPYAPCRDLFFNWRLSLRRFGLEIQAHR